MKLTLGYRPCPNDTFIFDALVNKKIHSEGLEFDTGAYGTISEKEIKRNGI